MGGAAPEPQRGRRSLDATLNLVPYVDIMMTLMVFLVMAAVFTQMSVLTVQSKSGVTAETAPDAPSLSMRLTSSSIAIEHDGAVVEVARAPLDTAGLERALRDAGAAADPSCTLRSDDGIRYSDIVEVIDVARRAGLTRMSLEPTTS